MKTTVQRCLIHQFIHMTQRHHLYNSHPKEQKSYCSSSSHFQNCISLLPLFNFLALKLISFLSFSFLFFLLSSFSFFYHTLFFLTGKPFFSPTMNIFITFTQHLSFLALLILNISYEFEVFSDHLLLNF